ncbi:MAG: chitobiase/beta-hexosaminidase C-terminal domain-containing protein [Cellulosilyticaceae bacterium]
MKKIFKKVASVFLSLLLTLPALPVTSVFAQDFNASPSSTQSTTSSAKKQVIGYITQWDAWKDTKAGLPAQGALNQLNIDYSKYTILNYSFFGVANDGSLHSGDFRNKNIYQPNAVQQPSPLLYTDIYSSWDLYLLFGEIEYVYYVDAAIAARAQAQGFVVKENGSTWSNPSWNLYNQPLPMPIKKEGGAPGLLELGKQNGVKVMASIGGWSMCKHFPEMAADPAKRARFIEDCKRLIAMGFDGIDLDWEYVGAYSGMNFTGSEADYANFITLVKEIRAAIGPDKLITSCFSANTKKLDGFNWPEIDKYVDYYNFMTYDVHGGWSNKAGHNSPLYSYTNAEDAGISIDDLYQYLQSTNINMSKVNMGLPFYGRGVVTNGSADLHTPTVKREETIQPDGPLSTCADYTNWPKDVYDGTPNYSYINQTVLKPNSGWTVKWDDEAKVPYATKGNFFLSYDNEESIGYKAQYIKDKDLAGAIVWNVFGDLEFGGSVTNYGTKLKKWSDVKSPLANKVNEVFNSGIVSVASPTFSLATGTYPEAQNVTINCATPGATIRYTTDGTEPTANSPLYSTAITVAKTTTLKAKAFKDGMYDSTTASATYTIPLEAVATPTFSPAGGTYPKAQDVTISCVTPDALIRYTNDGTEPTVNSPLYSKAITVAKTTTLKAKAFKDGMDPSATASATYTLALEAVAPPTFSPAGGTYAEAQNVTISCATPGATVRYTTDGSEPTANASLYNAPIAVSKTTTIKAKAFKDGMNDSTTASATFTIQIGTTIKPWAPNTPYVKGDLVSYNGKNYECRQPHTSLVGWEPPNVPALWKDYSGSVTPIETVATPTFSPNGGTFADAQNVTISCATSGATIRYTTDGSEPTASSSVYKNSIPVAKTTTLKAKAFKEGMKDSSTVSATFTIEVAPVETVASPTFSPNGGTFTDAQNVTINCATLGATIRYTTDGSEPTSSSAIYSNSISISASTTLKAKAFKEGMKDSSTASAHFTIEAAPVETVASPTFSPNGGTFTESQSVTISCSTSGATIRYTTDGSEPTTSSPAYSGSIQVSETTTLKAKAFKEGMNDSSTASATFTIESGTTVDPWTPKTTYATGAIVSYNGKTYRCVQGHTALAGWEPSAVPALWAEYTMGAATSSEVAVPDVVSYTFNAKVTLSDTSSTPTLLAEGKAWAPNTTYTQGDIVSYNTKNYECRQGHTSLPGWEPSVVPALWLDYSGPINPTETVATPTFSPNGGTFTSAQDIMLNCSTNGATIRYTTDDSEPTASSTLYTSPLSVVKTTTLKAKAFKDGMNDSATTSATFTIEVAPVETVAAPTFSPNGGTFTSAQTVTLNCSTNGATIRYTTAGSTPTASSTLYTNALSVDKTTTLKAKAFKDGMNDSTTTSATFTIEVAPVETVAAPTFSPNGGTFTSAQTVTLGCATNGATIRYTTDGTEPTISSPTYTSAIQVSKTTTLKAKAFKSGMNDSTTTSATYTIQGSVVVKPWASSTAYVKGDLVSYNGKNYECRQPHTSLLGWEPTNVPALWAEYTGPVTPIETVKAPTFSPIGGTYDAPQVVTLNCATSGATIRYTTDGSEPTAASTLYTSALNVAKTTTLKAKAFKAGMNDSSTTSATYTIQGLPVQTVATPTFSPKGGTYTTAQTVTLTCATPEATIRYTTNGTEPTASSAIYSTALTIANTTVLKAKAFKEGMADSDTTSATYSITSGGNTSLPKRLLIGYWHTWGGDASGGVPFVKLRDVNPNWDVINISFAEPVSPGSTDGRMKFEIPGLTPDYTVNDFKADIKLLQSQGKKVVLSIGGYVGYFSLTSPTAVNQFVSDIKGFVNEYGFDGIDIDLEQSSVTFNGGSDPDYKNPTSPKIVNMISAIRQICDAYGKDFILSWAPETFYMQLGYTYYGGLNGLIDNRAGVYLPMIHALRDKTTYVHTQLYNSMGIPAPDGKTYSMGNADAAVAMCKMLLDGFNVGGNPQYFFDPLRADQVVIGVPSSSGAAGSGHISNAALQQAFDTLVAKYPDLRGIMTWSINWDAFQNKDSFAISNGQYLDSKQ